MRRLGLLLLLMGCGPKPIPPPPHPTIIDCPVAVDLQPGLGCDGWFTSEGYACVLCQEPQAAGCLVPDVKAYCVAGGSCRNDPRCSEER